MSITDKFKAKITGAEILEKFSKLVFAIEPEDSLTGQLYINGTSKSYYAKELGKLLPPLTINPAEWYQCVQINRIPHHRFQHRSGNLIGTYKQYTHISADEIYTYYIYLENVYFFSQNKDVGFKVLDKKIIEDCRANRCLIVMSMPFEGTSGIPHHKDDFTIIDSWVKEFNLPKDNVIYITANQKCKEFTQDLSYLCEAVSCQEIWNDPANYNDDPLEFNPQLEKTLYLNYNRAYRYHRKIMLAYLHKHKLLHLGQNSWNVGNQILGEISQFDIELKDSEKYFESHPMQLVDHDLITNHAMSLNLDVYKKTFISLVTETLHYNETLFISEKIWKPIIVGHPFMVLGAPGILALLRKRGYRTFDNWLDESYDSITDLKQRILVIIKNLEKFASLDIKGLMRIRQEMDEVCVHNKLRLKQEINEKYKVNDIIIGSKPILEIITAGIDNLKSKQ